MIIYSFNESLGYAVYTRYNNGIRSHHQITILKNCSQKVFDMVTSSDEFSTIVFEKDSQVSINERFQYFKNLKRTIFEGEMISWILLNRKSGPSGFIYGPNTYYSIKKSTKTPKSKIIGVFFAFLILVLFNK